MSDYRVQRCQITEVVFYTKLLVNDILVGIERILDYAGVGLERFGCTSLEHTLYFFFCHLMRKISVNLASQPVFGET